MFIKNDINFKVDICEYFYFNLYNFDILYYLLYVLET